MVDKMDQECKNIRTEALKMAWWMRGGLTYNEVMGLSRDERDIISNIIKENIDTTKKSGLPFF